MESYLQKYIQERNKIDDGPPVRYQLQLTRVNLDKKSNAESKLRRFTLGKQDPQYPNKALLLVGATGSGKSTLINALVNFVMGVKFDDKVWFEVIEQEESRSETQTSAVSVYDLYGFEGKVVPYSLTIIDTPGFGDSRGIEYDVVVTEKLQDLFTVPDGVRDLNAVGLVLNATENRLDERMAYIFNSITSLFGRDMEKNIVAMLTHSARGKPEALQALERAHVKCARNKNGIVHFKFNNSQSFRIEDGSDGNEAQSAFTVSNKELKKFSDFLTNTESQSLSSTVKVLRERSQLKACIQTLKDHMTTIEIKQRTIDKNREELEKLGELTTENMNIMITIEEHYKEKEPIDAWWDNKATTCNNCQENCHYPRCTWAWSPSWCQVMRNGKCTSCRGRCPVKDHVRENWRYVDRTRTVKKPALELMNLEEEKSDLEKEKKTSLDEAFEHIEKLEKIALNVDSVFTYPHLEFLMERMSEIEETEKVQKLEELRDRMDEKNKAGAYYYIKSSME